MVLNPSQAEILEKRGLDVEALAAKGWETVRRGGTDFLSIPYVYRGKTINHKYRTLGPEKRMSQDAGIKRVFYNFDCLLDESLSGEALIITEGELDAESAIQAGFPRTVSVPDGAPATTTESIEKFAFLFTEEQTLIPELFGVTRIVLAVDDDDAGRNLYDLLCKFLGAARCQFIRYPYNSKAKTSRCKDLNEVLQLFGERGVRQTIEQAQYHPVPGIYALSELPRRNQRAGYNCYIPGLSNMFMPRTGDLTVVTGIPSHGKTTFCINLAYQMARNHQWRCLLALFETEVETDARIQLIVLHAGKRFKMCTPEDIKEAEEFIDKYFRFVVASLTDDTTLDWLFEKIESACLRFNCNFVLVDPWNELEHERPPGMNITDYTGAAIKRFKRAAKKFDTHIMICAHPTKEIIMGGRRENMPRPTLYDIEGSRHWYGKADTGIVVFRDFNRGTTTIQMAKVRYQGLIGQPGEVELVYNHENGRYELPTREPTPGDQQPTFDGL